MLRIPSDLYTFLHSNLNSASCLLIWIQIQKAFSVQCWTMQQPCDTYIVQIKKGLDDTTPQDALKPWYLESTGAITPSSETVWLFQIMGVLRVCAIHLKHRSFTFYCKLSIWVESHCGSHFSLNVMRPVVILSYDVFKLSRVLLRDTFMIAPG